MFEKLQLLLPSEKLEEFVSKGKIKTLAVSETFLCAGDIPGKIAFVEEGLFRYVYIDGKGDEFTKGLILEGSFLSSYSAMIQNRPSYFTIEALEPSRILELKWTDFLMLMDKDVFWIKLLLKFIEKGYIIKEKRERDLLLLDAETRYKDFLNEFPGVSQRISQGIIASYLGIKPETLSRIRHRIIS